MKLTQRKFRRKSKQKRGKQNIEVSRKRKNVTTK